MWNPYDTLNEKTRRNYGLISISLVIVLWSLATLLGFVSPALLPSPVDVMSALHRLAWSDTAHNSPLLIATGYSVARVFTAGILVMVVGIPLGILLGASPKINAFFSPIIDPFRSAPVVAFLPIMVMWLGIGESMKVAFLFLGSFVFMVPMVRDAILAVPQQYWISARDLGATPLEAVLKAVVPIAKPRIADAIITSISVMWTYITVAEYVNAERGIGQLIQNARRFSAMDQVFVGIGVIVFLALLTNLVLTSIKKKFYPWETEA